jgi:hypothetical protein
MRAAMMKSSAASSSKYRQYSGRFNGTHEGFVFAASTTVTAGFFFVGDAAYIGSNEPALSL